ncbi:CDP-alcohol phosphatidyltransferase family protein [Polaribacter ponticola]|uniref:CDP-alcohol phosphatidyltransferase family protein n=1 Tax=Polaribacter ponticola TaxID=2978475 RepID=A0ABT5S751_9FLAO|nr:CDP-alcohol phosphatidyltransferase family protein [Polaribacter sp. MSW5]MDD7913929.1 CDP-alcohol phosphatidyltransferase family protein [Polaribacter sp. MSW5]
MKIKAHIPNLLTLGNLLCGTIATIFAVQSDFVLAGIFVIIGIFFDFLDGFVARLLKVSGDLGKQLDSLADMVTSGVVPGIIMAKLIQDNLISRSNSFDTSIIDISIIGLILTLSACYRLAKFNIDTRQSDSFIGLPTPAMSLFVISLPLIQMYSELDLVQDLISNNYFLIGVTWVLSYLMNADIPLFSLKFKEYSLKNNWIRYLFLLISIILIFTLNFISIPIIILLYVILSLKKM